MLADHAISIGFVMCYSPYNFELILGLLYLVAKIVYEIRLQKFEKDTKQLKTCTLIMDVVFRIVNMALLICAMVGLSRTDFDDNNNCLDSDYQIS